MRKRLFSISLVFILFLGIIFEIPLGTNQVEALAQGVLPDKTAQFTSPGDIAPEDWQDIHAQIEHNRMPGESMDEEIPQFDALAERADVPLQQEAYLKASNTDAGDEFGTSVAIDGNTIVIGARQEDSDTDFINGDQNDNSAANAGAVYVFTSKYLFTPKNVYWRQQAYLKASNSEAYDQFGWSVAIDGNTIVVGAPGEDSKANVIYGDQNDNSATNAGAAYVFVRSEGEWRQQAYLKASNAEADDFFGVSVAIDGDTIVVGAEHEDSNAKKVYGDQNDNSAYFAGAAYVFVRSSGQWSQQAYLKPTNTDSYDQFGISVALSGNTIVVGAPGEDSNAVVIYGDQNDNSAESAGAAYVFVRSSGQWSQQAYLKADNTEASDYFGESLAIAGDIIVVGAQGEDSNSMFDPSNNSASAAGAAYIFYRISGLWYGPFYWKAFNAEKGDGYGSDIAISNNLIVVGAAGEDSNAHGLGGDQTDNSATESGAAYFMQYTQSNGSFVFGASAENYLKASNTEAGDNFGHAVAVDDATIVIGAWFEGSNARGVNGDQNNNSALASGAAYVFSFYNFIFLPMVLK